jgi:hypothetical protein
LEQCGKQPHLWLQANGFGFIKPIASYFSIDEKKKKFVQIILNLKTLTHYVSSLKKGVQKDGDLRGMKSHDFHAMMQHILPLCMCHLMAKGCRMAIICLSCVFKILCAKQWMIFKMMW